MYDVHFSIYLIRVFFNVFVVLYIINLYLIYL